MTYLLDNSQNSSVNFVPIREAAKRVSYTTDYVSRLAREGKINAKREGRIWLVDLDSLKLFSLQAKAEAIRKQEELKMSRKLELISIASNSAVTEKKLADRGLKQAALLESAAITICLALFFLLFQIIFSSGLGPKDLQNSVVAVGSQTNQALALNTITNFVWPDWLWLVRYERKEIAIEAENGLKDKVLFSTSSQIENSATIRPVQLDADNNTLVIPINNLNQDQSKYIASTFSDDVLVEFYDSRQGTITVNFLSGEREEYPFRLVNETVKFNQD